MLPCPRSFNSLFVVRDTRPYSDVLSRERLPHSQLGLQLPIVVLFIVAPCFPLRHALSYLSTCRSGDRALYRRFCPLLPLVDPNLALSIELPLVHDILSRFLCAVGYRPSARYQRHGPRGFAVKAFLGRVYYSGKIESITRGLSLNTRRLCI